ncbi:hypothetical protein MMC12_006659 [Toensbergia leucococca]|nr:hypothetical protein [Toensbergia leucococca]
MEARKDWTEASIDRVEATKDWRKARMDDEWHESVSLGKHRKDVRNRSRRSVRQIGLTHAFSAVWTVNYAILRAAVNYPEPDKSVELQLDVRTKGWIQNFGGASIDKASATKELKRIPSWRREDVFQNVMLRMLKDSPEHALVILDAAMSFPLFTPSDFALTESLVLLSSIFLAKVDTPDPLKLDTIHRLACKYFQQYQMSDARSPQVPQAINYLLVKHCDEPQIDQLLKAIGTHNAFLTVNTQLQIMTKFIEWGRITAALDVLRGIAISGHDLTADRVQSVCVRLLRTRFGHDDWYNVHLNIMAQMLEMGVRPNLILYNTILLNAAEAGDFKMVWHGYDLAKENGLKPDTHTYAILFKAARLSNDSDALDQITHEANETGILAEDQRLVTELLYAIHAIEHVKSHPEARRVRYPQAPGVFTTLLQTFKKYFDTRIFQELGILEVGLDPDIAKPPPSSRAVGIMLLEYLSRNRNSPRLSYIYTRYLSLICQNHPIIAPLAETDHIPNAFLTAWGRIHGRPDLLSLCCVVIQNMLEPPPTAVPLQIAKPTVQTWGILSAAYIHHGQPAAAEKILAVMKQKGMVLNQITWNSIIRGYAALQDIERTVDAVRRMEMEGFETDGFTLEGLGKVRDRGALMEALRKTMAEDVEEGNREGRDREEVMDGVGGDEGVRE